jgi:2-polyprenyl-3-methyl-5-hydroxy-6-metoxy-1,4-benzoquinol methylase
MEENIRLFAGSSVVDANGCVVGEMIGPFAKMGKCKVKFSSIEEGGISVAHLPALKSSLSIVLPSDTAAN